MPVCEDADLLEEELCAVSAIFGDDCSIDEDEKRLTAWIPNREASPRYELRLIFPTSGYPSEQPPEIHLIAPHLSDDMIDKTIDELYDLFLPGEVVVFNMTELLKEKFDAAWGDTEPHICDEDPEPLLPDHPTATPEPAVHMDEAMQRMARVIITGQPHTERKSTFQAHVAPVRTREDVRAMVAVLLLNPKVARATHNMWAYRIRQQGSGTFLQDCDDDGEAAAGSRMLHLLQVTEAEGVCVVVSRWFGGVLLGPSRFGLINNTARRLLVDCGYIPQATSRRTKR